MTTLKTIFKKPVDRPIEGVIKADDEACLRLEIEEYVLTNEIESRLESFLEAYNNYAGANGVWVSGFFGSGKSHLLKMMALLMENRQIDGASALDLFLPKCGNEILRADLKRAVGIPSKSILFNIDQKADVISKTQIDALLAVFVKVFDEMCGYYGKQGHIAQFERDLDSRGLYEKFKTTYETLAGRTWQQGREQALLESKNIAKTYAQVTNSEDNDVEGILDKYRTQYHVTIEDFAQQVNFYIEQQPDNFRLNFFIDEVGQYIADNVKLMTNLQTIAESLATKCRGRAWIIVTSQSDMSTVLGDQNKQQSNDFSKIMARFETKMPLTGTNVAEVIQKRLLAKTDQGTDLISDLYHQQSNNFGTLFSFSDGSRSYKIYQDKDEFINCYPFVPYQFELFQTAIENLSRHNVFEGKHTSVGERSMLAVFQQVAVKISDLEIGQLASFDLMFQGIQTALKSQAQKAILAAERQLENKFAIALLKTLFLVKYVKEFKPTLNNLCILMLNSFNHDLPQLRKQIEEALSLLEQQTYIQRNGEYYEYLTDEEKDVEEEIKNTEVENTDVAAELEKIVFDYVIKSRKIRYDINNNTGGQDYPYSRKLDDKLHGREYELAIHIISPFHENSENESTLLMQSMGRNELLVVMPSDERLVRDILMYKRTEKYIRQNISITQQEAVKRILNDKGLQNQERYVELKKRLQSLLGQAKLFVSGNNIECSSQDGQSRIIRGFHELIARVYPNLNMLRGMTYTENDIASCLQHSQDGLFGNDVTTVPESEQEVLSFIQSNNRSGVRTTLKSLLEKFERKPYGWYYAAILCTLAKLCARSKVELRTDSNLTEDNQLERTLRNTHGHSNVVLEPQIDFTASQVRALKEFYADFFDEPPTSNEAKILGQETGVALKKLVHELELLVAQVSQYPFLTALTPVLEKFAEITGKPYTWYLTELVRQEDLLLDMKEGIIDPIRKFMSGAQKEIFDNACKFIQTQEANFTYIKGDEAAQIIANMTDLECFKGNSIKQIKSLLDSLQKKLSAKLSNVRVDTIARFNAMQTRMQSMSEYQKLPDVRRAELNKPYADLIEDINKQQLIAVINDRLRYFEEQGYQNLLRKMVEMATPKPQPQQPQTNDKQNAQPEIHEPPVEYIHSRKLHISYEKAWLADEADVDRYLESMRKTLLEEIRNGKRIQI